MATVSTAADWQNLSAASTSGDKGTGLYGTHTLENDIYLGINDVVPQINTPLFGVFDGQGFTIRIDGKTDYGPGARLALFPNVIGGEIRNLTVIFESIEDNLGPQSFAQVLSGLVSVANEANLENVHIVYENIVLGSYIDFSTLVGNSYMTSINGCTVTGSIELTHTGSTLRGLVGSAYMVEVAACESNMDLKANVVRGMGTTNTSSFNRCKVTGDLDGTQTVVGFDDSGYKTSFISCAVDSNITGRGNIAGMTRGDYSFFRSCRVSGTITGQGAGSSGQIGGVASGGTESNFLNCTVDARIEGESGVAGICAGGDGAFFLGCEFTGELYNRTDISGGGPQVAGIASEGRLFESCRVDAIIEANGIVGGIASKIDSYGDTAIRKCSFAGTINGQPRTRKSVNVGGIVGEMLIGRVEECSSSGTANISGAVIAAGILANASGPMTVRDCFSSAQFTECDSTGGIVGITNGGQLDRAHFAGTIDGNNRALIGSTLPGSPDPTVTSSYYNSALLGTPPVNAIGDPKLSAAFLLMDTFVGWDFVSIWQILEDDTFPTLQHTPGARDLFAGGSGTEQDPWLVETVEHLKNVRLQNFFDVGSSYYKQIDSIDLGGEATWLSWADATDLGDPSSVFHGHYDGDYHEINGLTQTIPESFGYGYSQTGLAGQMRGGSLKRIIMKSAYVENNTRSGQAALLVVSGRGTIDECVVEGEVVSYYAGGLCVRMEELVCTACGAIATLRGVWSGGFAVSHGRPTNATATDCFARGDIYEPPARLKYSPDERLQMAMFVTDAGTTASLVAFNRCYSAVKIHPEPHGTGAGESKWPLYESSLWFLSSEYGPNQVFYLNNCYMDTENGGPQAQWAPERGYFRNRFIRGRDGQLYRCHTDQTAYDYEGVVGGNPPVFTRAEPGVGSAWTDYWELVTGLYPNARTTSQMKSLANYPGWDFVDLWRLIPGETYPEFLFASKPEFLELQFHGKDPETIGAYLNAGVEEYFDVWSVYRRADSSYYRELSTARAKLLYKQFSQDGEVVGGIDPNNVYTISTTTVGAKLFVSKNYGTIEFDLVVGNVTAPITIDMDSPISVDFLEVVGGVRQPLSSLVLTAGSVKRVIVHAEYLDGYVYDATYDSVWNIQNGLDEDNSPANVLEFSTNTTLLRARVAGTAEVTARYYGTIGLLPVAVVQLVPSFQRVVAEASDIVGIFRLPIITKGKTYFRVSAYADADGTVLIRRVDSLANPELFLVSKNKGISWQPIGTDGVAVDDVEALYRCGIQVGPRNKFWLSIGASVGAGEVDDPDINAPVISLDNPGGTYNDEVLYVTLTTDEPATIWYTLDGRTPNTNSSVYTRSIAISSDATLRLFAEDAVGNRSAMLTHTYVFDRIAPVVSVNLRQGPNYLVGREFLDVIFTTDKPGRIYYTTDGTDPVVGESDEYTDNPLQLRLGDEVTYRIVAIDTVGNISPVLSHYVIVEGAPPGSSIDLAIELAAGTESEPNTLISEVDNEFLFDGVYYKLTGMVVGSKYEFLVSESTNNIDLQLALYSPDQTFLANFDGAGAGRELYEFTAPYEELFIKVIRYGGSPLDTTTLTLHNIIVVPYPTTSFNSPFIGDIETQNGVAVPYRLETQATECFIRFTGLEPGSSYMAQTSQVAGRNTFDSRIYVYNVLQNQIAYDDDGGSGTFSKATFTIPNDGTITIKVNSWGTLTRREDFNLTVTKV